MTKTNTLSQQLKNYSLLAGSILASSFVTKGQVIHTDVIPDRELGGVTPSSYPFTEVDSIDLNNDGQFDFEIALAIIGPNTAVGGFSFAEGIDGNFDPSHNAIFTYSIEYVPWAFKLDCEDSIPLNAQFYGLNSANFAYQFGTYVAVHWNNVQDGHIGVKFNIGGETHYGWIRLDVNTNDTVPNIVIKDYAYEATADKKILTCDTGFAVGTQEVILDAETPTIYPNPSNGTCVIKFQEPLKGEMAMQVADALGRTVFETMVPAQTRELPFDFSHFANGIYFIRMQNGTVSFQEKWIKN